MIDVILPKILEPFYCKDLIRLGRNNDGGYLVSKEDVIRSSKLLSFGIGDDISFEEDFSKINECDIHAYDGTIDSQFNFFDADHRKIFFNNIGPGTGNKKISELLTETDKNIFIKCDIEGGEYDILNELIIYSNKFSGIVIEFHDVYQYPLFNLVTNFISKIQLKLIHTHMNNISYAKSPDGYLPGCIELSFTSSNNISLSPVNLPHILDMPNTPSREEFRILF